MHGKSSKCHHLGCVIFCLFLVSSSLETNVVVLETGFIFLLRISMCEIIVFLGNLEVIVKEITANLRCLLSI